MVVVAGKNKKIITFVTVVSLLFFVLIAFDVTPYLRGPAPYPPDWRWEYHFINTIHKVWLPLGAIGSILWFAKTVEKKGERWKERHEKRILTVSIILCLVFQCSVLFFSRAGIPVLLHRIINPNLNGYFTAALQINSLPNFLASYGQQVLHLPMHAQGHPPGAILFFWVIQKIAASIPFQGLSFLLRVPAHSDVAVLWNGLSLQARAAAVFSGFFILVLAASVLVPMYYLTKKVYGTLTAFRSISLYIFVPSVTLFLPINDVFLAFFPLCSFLLLLVGIEKKASILGFMGGVIFSLGLFFSISLLPLLFAMGIYSSLEFFSKKTDFYEVMHFFISFLLGLVLFYIVLDGLFGYNVFQVMKTLMSGLPVGRVYWTWVIYNFYDFFVFLGICSAFLYLASVGEQIKLLVGKRKNVDIFVISITSMLLLLNFSGSVRGEVGRIWLPFVPFFISMIAAYSIRFQLSKNMFLWVLFLQAVQVLIMQEFWVTLW